METIATDKAPPAIGLYCAGKRVENQIWCSGQTACVGVATLSKRARVKIDCVVEV